MKNETIFRYNTKSTSGWPWEAGIFILLQIMAGISIWQFLLNFLYLVIFQFCTKLSKLTRMMSNCNHDYLMTPGHYRECFKPHKTCHIITYAMSLLSLTSFDFCWFFPCHNVLVSPWSLWNSSWHQWKILPTYIANIR